MIFFYYGLCAVIFFGTGYFVADWVAENKYRKATTARQRISFDIIRGHQETIKDLREKLFEKEAGEDG